VTASRGTRSPRIYNALVSRTGPFRSGACLTINTLV
jgi:hypothetical protein